VRPTRSPHGRGLDVLARRRSPGERGRFPASIPTRAVFNQPHDAAFRSATASSSARPSPRDGERGANAARHPLPFGGASPARRIARRLLVDRVLRPPCSCRRFGTLRVESHHAIADGRAASPALGSTAFRTPRPLAYSRSSIGQQRRPCRCKQLRRRPNAAAGAASDGGVCRRFIGNHCACAASAIKASPSAVPLTASAEIEGASGSGPGSNVAARARRRRLVDGRRGFGPDRPARCGPVADRHVPPSRSPRVRAS